jgi:hypothetical protein
MSTYHATMKIMRAGKTMSHLAYITRTGKYRSKTDLLFTKSENLPDWAKNANDFWCKADEVTQQKNKKQTGVERPTSRTGRTWDFALPNELSNEELIRFTDEYLKKQFPDYPYTYAIHIHESAIHQKSNPHVHVIFTEYKMNDRARQLDKETFFERHGISRSGKEYGGAEREWDLYGRTGKKLRELRRNLADEINRAYEEKGLPQRVTEKSIEVQREEALNAGNIRQADAFDRPKPKRLAPKKFKKYQEVISEKVREGWRDADLSDIRDKDVVDRICQEFEKQVNAEALDRMAKEQIMEATDQEKLAAVEEQLRDIAVYKTALPTREESCGTIAKTAERELRKREKNLLLAHTRARIRPLQKEKYKAELNQKLQRMEMETLQSASDEEKIREYAVRLFAEQAAGEKLTAALSGEELTKEEREDLFTLKEMAAAAMERAKKAGITEEFVEAHREEIDRYTESLRLLNIIDKGAGEDKDHTAMTYDHQAVKDRRQNLLDARVAELINEYRKRLYGKPIFRYDESSELDQRRKQLKRCEKRKHVSPAVQQAVKNALSFTRRKHDQIMLRAELEVFPGTEKDKNLSDVEKYAEDRQKDYIKAFYRLTPHSAEYELKKLIDEDSGKELKTLREKLRSAEAKRELCKKMKRPAGKIEDQITALRRSIAEKENSLRTRERIAKAAENSKRSWEDWPANRIELRRKEQKLAEWLRDVPLPKYLEESIRKTLEKFKNKTSRQALLDYAVREKFAEYQNRVDALLPKSEKACALDLIRKASGGKLDAIDGEIKYLRKLKRSTPAEDLQRHANLDNRIKEASTERSELIASYTTPELLAKAAEQKAAAELDLEKNIHSLRSEQARLVLKQLSRRHISPQTRHYCEEILKKATKKIDAKEMERERRVLMYRRHTRMLRQKMNGRIKTSLPKQELENAIASMGKDIFDLPKTGTGRANLNIRHDRDIEMER